VKPNRRGSVIYASEIDSTSAVNGPLDLSRSFLFGRDEPWVCDLLHLGPLHAALSDRHAKCFSQRRPTCRRTAFGKKQTSHSRWLMSAFGGKADNANGARVDQGKLQVSGNTMRVGLKSLSQGTYHVRWRALSVDTHNGQSDLEIRQGRNRRCGISSHGNRGVRPWSGRRRWWHENAKPRRHDADGKALISLSFACARRNQRTE
jgi:hypothetical protein